MKSKFLFTSFTILSFVSLSVLSVAQEQDVKALIQQLGDDSYVVRQRAEAQLLRMGVSIYAELRAALNNSDAEIVRRAEQIIQQFNLVKQGDDDENVRIFKSEYPKEASRVKQARWIQILASPDFTFGNPSGSGLQMLCRLLRSEKEHPLRAEAAKALIASAPHTESVREKWYQTLTEQQLEAEQDELCSLVFQFAQVRTAVNVLKKNTEKKYKEEARKNNTPLNYPVKLTPDAQLMKQVKEIAAAIGKFQKAPENNTLIPGSWFDILVYYAIAELYEDLGLIQERDTAQKAAVAVRPKPIAEDLLAPVDPLDGRPFFNEHFFVARFLSERNRFRWVLDHCKIVLQDGSIAYRRDAFSMAANSVQMLGDYEAAAEFLQQKIDLVKSDDYKRQYSDSDEQIRNNEARRFYCLAQQSADSGDWKKAAELIEEVLKRDPEEIDTLILRYEALKRLPELDANNKDSMKNLIEGAVRKVEQHMHSGMFASVVCNQAAWLLANTGGDYQTALDLISITMKEEPESPVYLDTQAHVFALGKEYKKAVETQEEAVRLAPDAEVFRKALEKFRSLR
ncbi:MAG: hypothetical protein FWE67_08040 [Planctomycetaceae bacterium]|nr:hypothetical protein [Planctomycetaceae bacterium]